VTENRGAISWFTPPIGDGVGYGYVAISLIRAIQARGVDVGFTKNEPKVHVNFAQPTLYLGLGSQYRVGYTPWESTALDPIWVSTMQQQDEIWTTSDFCMEVFKKYNVHKKLTKVPHGISDVWEIYEREIGDKFVFMHSGSPTMRKGSQRVVDAFLDLFEGNDHFHLLMKSTGPSDARWRKKDGVWMGNANNHPQITTIDSYLQEEDLVSMYKSANCMVYPTNGEGWGLAPWQAIATGMPTICTNATGCADFAELSIPLDSKPIPAYGVHLGNWVEPDADDLRDKMKWVTENYAEAREKVMHSARVVHDTQSWSNVADQVIDILGEKIFELC